MNTIQKLDKLDILNLKDKRLRHVNTIAGSNFIITLKKFQIWYTLHRDRQSNAFYSSDKKENDKSPKWYKINRHRIKNQLFLSLKSMIIRIWIKNNDNDESIPLFLEVEVHFDGLNVFNEDISGENQLIFEIFNHNFTAPIPHNNQKSHEKLTNLFKELSLTKSNGRTTSNLIRSSYPLSLMTRLHEFKKVIHETDCKINRLKTIILVKYEKTAKLRELKAKKMICIQRIQTLNETLTQSKYRIENFKEKFRNLSHLNENRLKNQIEKVKLIDTKQQKPVDLSNKNEIMFKELVEIKSLISNRQKYMIKELSEIYCIQLNNQKIEYNEINSCRLNANEQQTSIAIGYIAHCLILICNLLNIPLRYPIVYRASKSLIYDLPNGELNYKELQLFKNKTVQEQNFNYALFLLNKNVVQLRILFDNFKNIDVNNILGNLHWMLNNC